MKIKNPLQLNDWEINEFLIIVLSIQIAMWGAIGLDVVGFKIPILRQFVSFIYLSFVPGIVILRILKLHRLGNILTLLYAVGLSLSTLMFTGFLTNAAYLLLGINGPISTLSLIISISAVILVLCNQCYLIDKNFSCPDFIEIRDIFSKTVMSLFLIPFIVIFGTYFVNFHQNNIYIIFSIFILSAIVILIGFDTFIPIKLYPLAVFIITISLLFHNSLISMYLWGWDIHLEYYTANLVVTNSIWDSTIPSNLNAMLSIVMLAPVFSEISNISIIWVFKIIYPLIFALLPLGLYRVFQKQTNDKIAFLACFFFVSVNTFYVDMLSLLRQQIAELFLVLLILSLIEKDIDKIKRSFLLIVFSFSLVVSHYGLSYIYIGILIFSLLLLIIYEKPDIYNLLNGFRSKFNGSINEKFSYAPYRGITSGFVLLFVVFALTWYIYVSSSSLFATIVRLSDQIAGSIYADFLNPEAAQGLKMMMIETPTPIRNIHKIINYLNQIFIVIGIVFVLLKRSKFKFDREFLAFSCICVVILLAGISVPFFASAINMTRLYQITLIFLAPFSVIGGIAFLSTISRKCTWTLTENSSKGMLKILSIYFVIFLLYQIGFVYQVTDEYYGSVSISQNSVREYGNAINKAYFYETLNVFEQDVYSAGWFHINVNLTTGTKVYADLIASYPLRSYGMTPIKYNRMLTKKINWIEPEAFVFLGYANIVEDVGLPSGTSPIFNRTEISPFLSSLNKIYVNGGSEIYVR